MIAYIKGVLAAVGPDSVIVDVHGVGYEIQVPAVTLANLPAPGQEVQLHTHLHVREDLMQLFGFLELRQLQLFQLLLEVSGVGPRGALAALSALGVEQLAEAILGEDISLLTSIPGVGKKTAQRMVIELKDKLAKAWGYRAGGRVAEGGMALDDALEALAALGFDRQDVQPWLIQARATLGESCRAEDLIRFVLREKGKSQ